MSELFSGPLGVAGRGELHACLPPGGCRCTGPMMSSLADSRPFRDVESQLRDLTQDFATSFNTGNYDQAAALFAGDGVLMAPQLEAAYGQKPVERLLRQLGEAGYSDLRLETTRVEHSGDMAMEFGRFTVVAAEGRWNDDAGAREICESVAAAGSVAAHGRLLEPDGRRRRAIGRREA